MSPDFCLAHVVNPALSLLPAAMTSDEARAMLIATAWQESKLTARRQQPAGPARGYWMFEKTGGVLDVLTRRGTRVPMMRVCKLLDLDPTVEAVYEAIQFHDILAAVAARLLLWILPERLPGHLEVDLAWHQYRKAWRPGKPRPVEWPESFAVGWDAVDAVSR